MRSLVMPLVYEEGVRVAVISNSTVIRCTPEAAFDYLSDPRNDSSGTPA